MQSISTEIPIHYTSQFAILDVALFFRNQLRELCDKYGYSDAEYAQYMSWHQPRVLIEKILDPNRFFRIVRDINNRMIGFFESRSRIIDGEKVEIIQWLLIDSKYRRQGVAKELWTEFFLYCLEKQSKKVYSFVKLSNQVSCEMHDTLGFIPDNIEDGMIRYVLEFRKI